MYKTYVEVLIEKRSLQGVMSELKTEESKNAYLSNGDTVLAYAIRHSFDALVYWLLDQNVEVSKPTLKKETPLMVAVWMNNATMTKALLEAGADMEYCDSQSRTALYIAKLIGAEEILSIITSR